MKKNIAAGSTPIEKNLRPRTQGGPLHFIANRDDGFGERLRAILNAIVASRICEGKFILNWRTLPEELVGFNSIKPAPDVFSQNYIDAYHFGRPEINNLNQIEANEARFSQDFIFLGCSDVDAIIMSQAPLKDQIPDLALAVTPDMYAAAFDSISFTSELEAARQAARSIPFKNDIIAIHMRAGDIVYGKFAVRGTYTGKTVPYPLVESLIEKFLCASCDVVLFGQDQELCRYLKQKYGIYLATEFSSNANFSVVAQALFEICLMARCHRIFCGSSGFALVASWIGDARVSNATDVFTGLDIIKLILRQNKVGAPAISDAQIAYSYYFLLDRFSKEMTLDEKHKAIDMCYQYRPDNPLYILLKARRLYRQGREQAAETLLKDSCDLSAQYDMAWTLRDHKMNKARPIVISLIPFAEAGQPLAALFLAISHQAMGEMDKAQKFAYIYFKNRYSIRTKLDIYINNFTG